MGPEEAYGRGGVCSGPVPGVPVRGGRWALWEGVGRGRKVTASLRGTDTTVSDH